MRPLQQRPWLLPAATAALAVLALGAAAIARWRLGCSFTEVSPGSGVFRCVQPYLSVALAPVLIRVDETKGLLLKKRVPHWVLVDAGFRDSWALGPYVSALTRAVQRRLAAAPTAGSLDLIVCESPPTGASYCVCLPALTVCMLASRRICLARRAT